MERDLSLFMEHTDKHIADEVMKRHPNWVTKEGFCPKCLEYFKKAMRDPEAVAAAESLETTNISPKEVRQRFVVGAIGFGLAAIAFYWLRAAGAPSAARLILFPLFFIGFLGVLQARRKLCVIIAQKQAAAMRLRALKILCLAAILAALFTAGSLL
jgi:hypothetical protein